MLLCALRHDARSALFYGLADEIMTIDFFPPQCHEQAILLHSPRVIRDTFHCAIKCPDDLANWNRGGKSFELHEVSASGRKAFNGMRHWLRRRAPPAGPCEFPHAAQDPDNVPPFLRYVKRLDRLPCHHSSIPACSSARRPARPNRQIRGDPPADNR